MLIAALILQVLLIVYHQATTWLDFFPFNGARFYPSRERVLEAGSNLVMMTLPLVGFVLHLPALMKFGVVYYFVLFTVECATWWAPYFFGAAPKWSEMHARLHGQTITILPKRAGCPTPNLEHLILMALTLIAAIATLAAYPVSGGVPFAEWQSILIASALFGGGTFYQFVLAGRRKLRTRPGVD